MDQQVSNLVSIKENIVEEELKSGSWISITNIKLEIYEDEDWIIFFFDDATSMIMKCLEIFFFLYIQDMNIYYLYLSIFFKNNKYLIRNWDYNLILWLWMI